MSYLPEKKKEHPLVKVGAVGIGILILAIVGYSIIGFLTSLIFTVVKLALVVLVIGFIAWFLFFRKTKD